MNHSPLNILSLFVIVGCIPWIINGLRRHHAARIMSFFRPIYLWVVESFTYSELELIEIHTKDYGALGVRVYVSDPTRAAFFSKLTKTKTLTERHCQALVNLGYTFALSSPEPMSIPTWLLPFIDDEVTGQADLRAYYFENVTI